MKQLLIGIIFGFIIVNTILFVNGIKYLKIKGLSDEQIKTNAEQGKKYFKYTSIFSLLTIIIVTIILIVVLKM